VIPFPPIADTTDEFSSIFGGCGVVDDPKEGLMPLPALLLEEGMAEFGGLLLDVGFEEFGATDNGVVEGVGVEEEDGGCTDKGRLDKLDVNSRVPV